MHQDSRRHPLRAVGGGIAEPFPSANSETGIARFIPVILYEAALPGLATTFIGPSVVAQLGFSEGEFLGDTWSQFIHEEDKAGVEQTLARAQEGEDGFHIGYRFWNKARTQFTWFEDRGVIERDAEGRPVRVHGAMMDVTQMHAMLHAMQTSESRYRQIFHINPVPLWIYDLESLRFLLVNEAAMRNYGYSQAEFEAMTLLDIRPQEDESRLKDEVSRRPAGLYEAGIWRHRRKDGSLMQVRIVSHELDYEGSKAELVLALDVTEPLENARSARRAEAEVKQGLVKIIEVLAAATEQRDPYTAGHQDRVARLAMAIGTVLSLPDERLEGLRLAALVHDIGKFGVPAGILALPRRLTPPEEALVRQHPEAGYALLKDVAFPWPIAEVVRHHHERLDGSGYPNGLRGDQICLEARSVVAVDVVEAMSSHRPYWPALGVAAVMAEIPAGRGTRYDAAVVDACRGLIVGGFGF